LVWIGLGRFRFGLLTLTPSLGTHTNQKDHYATLTDELVKILKVVPGMQAH